MNRDVFAFMAPKGLRRMEDLPKGYRMPSMGSRDEVIAAIRRLAPQVDESDPEWLVVSGPDFTFEVSLGSEADIDSFMFFVPAGERSDPLLLAIARALGATLFDSTNATFMTAEDLPSRELGYIPGGGSAGTLRS